MHGIERRLAMNTEEKSGEIWSTLDKLSAQEIIRLVEAAVYVLKPASETPEDLSKMPSAPLTSILYETLANKGVNVDKADIPLLISEGEVSLALCKELLGQIAENFPELAFEVEKTYHVRQKMMGIEPVSWLLAGAILVLAIKVKEIDLNKKRIKFHDLSDNAIRAVCRLLGIP